MNGHDDQHGRSKLDHEQFKILMLEVRGLRHAIQSVALAIVHSSKAGDEKAIAELADRLKESQESLAATIQANQP